MVRSESDGLGRRTRSLAASRESEVCSSIGLSGEPASVGSFVSCNASCADVVDTSDGRRVRLKRFFKSSWSDSASGGTASSSRSTTEKVSILVFGRRCDFEGVPETIRIETGGWVLSLAVALRIVLESSCSRDAEVRRPMLFPLSWLGMGRKWSREVEVRRL